MKFSAALLTFTVLYRYFMATLHSAFRDIKEENVLIDGEGYARISDFGLSMVLREGVARTVCGTPEYRAPELWRGLPYGTPVDWWALGVMTYSMLAGAVSNLLLCG
jgi:serine/threonine protein kinase